MSSGLNIILYFDYSSLQLNTTINVQLCNILLWTTEDLIYFYITYNNVQRLIIQLNIYYKISNRLDISLAGSSSTSSTFYPEGTGRTSSYTSKSTSRLFNIFGRLFDFEHFIPNNPPLNLLFPLKYTSFWWIKYIPWGFENSSKNLYFLSFLFLSDCSNMLLSKLWTISEFSSSLSHLNLLEIIVESTS